MASINRFLGLGMISAGMLLAAQGASGALVVTNGSFEADGTGANSTTLSAWFEENQVAGATTQQASSEQALFEGTNANIPATPHGTMWGHFINRGNVEAIYQDLGTWSAGDATQYTLTALLADRSNQAFSVLTIEFWSVKAGDGGAGADGTTFADAFSTELLLATHTTQTVDGGGAVATEAYSHDFAFDLANLSDGDSIWLRISEPSTGSETHSLIDNIEVVAVPEPASLALMGLGGLAMLRRRAR